MNLDPIIALVDAIGIFKKVGTVEELADLASEPTLGLPAAFVISDSLSAQDAAGGTQIFEQLVTELFAVVVIVGADGARRGAAQGSLQQLEEEVIAALAGTMVAGVERPLSLADSRLLGLGAGRASRLIRFRAIRRFRTIRPL